MRAWLLPLTLFLGGTDFIADYEHGMQFQNIQAHSVNVGVSVPLTNRCGFDVLPLILGTTGSEPTYSAAFFWRCNLWTFPKVEEE